LFWLNNCEDDHTELENKLNILANALSTLIQISDNQAKRIESLELQLEELTVNYLDHMYRTYHLTKDENEKVKLHKPPMSLEDDFVLRRAVDTLKNRLETGNNFSPTPKPDEPFSQ